jgi:hypothetical protein
VEPCLDLPHARRAIVIQSELHAGHPAFRNVDVEFALTEPITRLQGRIDALDSRILEHDLHAFLELVDVQGWAGAQLDAIGEVRGAHVLVPLDLDRRELPFDDVHTHDAVLDLLVRQDGARIDVAGVHVDHGQLAAQLLELGRGNGTIQIPGDDGLKRLVADDRIAVDFHAAKHERGSDGNGCFGFRRLDGRKLERRLGLGFGFQFREAFVPGPDHLQAFGRRDGQRRLCAYL